MSSVQVSRNLLVAGRMVVASLPVMGLGAVLVVLGSRLVVVMVVVGVMGAIGGLVGGRDGVEGVPVVMVGEAVVVVEGVVHDHVVLELFVLLDLVQLVLFLLLLFLLAGLGGGGRGEVRVGGPLLGGERVTGRHQRARLLGPLRLRSGAHRDRLSHHIGELGRGRRLQVGGRLALLDGRRGLVVG